ncbi:hypothetical protein O8H76_001049 [Enterobacter hormaechei]|jgi:hypothetical protein|nr:hypothetical protein [Enterobacter hormaechei]HCM9256105.1 hypothetical protein [Enterobacter cloacae subsp. dissolvens]
MDGTQDKVAVRSEAARQINMDMFKEFLKDSGFNDEKIVCTACGNHDFVIPIGDDVDGVLYPVVVTMPIPNKAGKGVWNFIAVCEKCTNTLFFNVGVITNKLKDSGKL